MGSIRLWAVLFALHLTAGCGGSIGSGGKCPDGNVATCWASFRAARQQALDTFLARLQEDFASFKNAPLGDKGIPMVMFRLFPVLFPDIWGAEDEHLAPIGLGPDTFEPGRVLPLGIGHASSSPPVPLPTLDGVVQVDVRIAQLTCMACHTGRVLDHDGNVRLLVGAPSTTFMQFQRAVLSTDGDADLGRGPGGDARAGAAGEPGDRGRRLVRVRRARARGAEGGLAARVRSERARGVGQARAARVAVLLGVVTAAGFVEPVRLAGRVIGVLEAGVFKRTATDPRGTVFAENGEAPSLATPYGVRGADRPDVALALDYAEKGYDADLDAVRMGVRDYDPKLGQFWQPDPLYWESIDRCAASAVDCNLYGYARGNPISFTDPSGMEPDKKQGAVRAVADAAADVKKDVGIVTGVADRVKELRVHDLAKAVAPLWTADFREWNLLSNVPDSVSLPSDVVGKKWAKEGAEALLERPVLDNKAVSKTLGVLDDAKTAYSIYKAIDDPTAENIMSAIGDGAGTLGERLPGPVGVAFKTFALGFDIGSTAEDVLPESYKPSTLLSNGADELIHGESALAMNARLKIQARQDRIARASRTAKLETYVMLSALSGSATGLAYGGTLLSNHRANAR